MWCLSAISHPHEVPDPPPTFISCRSCLITETATTRGPKHHTNIRILQTIVSGIPLALGLRIKNVASLCLCGLCGPENSLAAGTSLLPWVVVRVQVVIICDELHSHTSEDEKCKPAGSRQTCQMWPVSAASGFFGQMSFDLLETLGGTQVEELESCWKSGHLLLTHHPCKLK